MAKITERKDWSKATNKQLEKEAKRRYNVGDLVNQKTAYFTPEGKPIGETRAIVFTDEVEVEMVYCDVCGKYRNVVIGVTGVYNTLSNKWAKVVGIATPQKAQRKKQK